ncbi:enoyl-CoA hydratase/isomerase family protein [Spirosoma utsteinense]|uniref:Enoyl-CoA hydratase/carnithine racemase n=1 Tax=Spirosoma utsteinense TaxID=2585773 RepID=A0ABR6W6U4_9BACT|nr:enoyl-CoA hydratase-related protein [Spirosoma utsteinense]MBC3786118.1 enoyl-CoA hydratase/carnithine racemase [Spirosoma utsteinense]MBC3792307.1 enoyl-CoA hydratase/carnithine racemase [Spirosoma utsteinense]
MLYTPDQVARLPEEGFHFLIVTLDDHRLTITLNRPAKKNALHPAMLNELAFALAYAQYNPAVWLIVLAAAGDTFCAGMDLKALSQPNDGLVSGVERVPVPPGPVRLGELMAALHKPCIAQVQGPVYAGGFLLVGGSTYVVAAASATFSLPEVRRGLFPFQVLAVLRDIMPARTALDLCLRARTLSAVDAQAIGLVTDVVEADDLADAVFRLASELKQYSPTAMQFGLRAAQQLKSLPSEEQQAFLYEQFQQLQQTKDAKEGMAAFLEKRKPEWEG